jgi:hypothetical protein
MTTLAADLYWIALASSVLGSVAALSLARREYSHCQPLTALAWLVVGIGLAGALVVDQFDIRPQFLDETLFTIRGWKISTFEMMAPSIAAIGGMFIIYQVRAHRLACCFILIAILSAFTNPLTEIEENRLTSNGDNYTFVSFDQPFRFSDDASNRLAPISSIQELSECISIFSICAGLSAFAFVSPKPGTRRVTAMAEHTGAT